MFRGDAWDSSLLPSDFTLDPPLCFTRLACHVYHISPHNIHITWILLRIIILHASWNMRFSIHQRFWVKPLLHRRLSLSLRPWKIATPKSGPLIRHQAHILYLLILWPERIKRDCIKTQIKGNSLILSGAIIRHVPWKWSYSLQKYGNEVVYDILLCSSCQFALCLPAIVIVLFIPSFDTPSVLFIY